LVRNRDGYGSLAFALKWKQSATWIARRSLPATLGVRTGSIAHDDLNAEVLAQPVGEHVGSAIVEEVGRTIGLEIDRQGAIATLLCGASNVVDAQTRGPRWATCIGERV